MKSVGIRELKRGISGYLRDVRSGSRLSFPMCGFANDSWVAAGRGKQSSELASPRWRTMWIASLEENEKNNRGKIGYPEELWKDDPVNACRRARMKAAGKQGMTPGPLKQTSVLPEGFQE